MSLAGLLNDSMERWAREHVWTMLPGRVEKVDLSKGAVDVLPLVKDYDEDEEGNVTAVSLPVVPNVPLVQPGGGGKRLTLPVAVGDVVLLWFARRSLDKWKTYGGEVDPDDRRMFNISDAIAFPCGKLSFNAPWQTADANVVTVGSDDGAADWVARAGEVKAELTALRNTVNALVTAFNANTASLIAHVHPSNGVVSAQLTALSTASAPAVVNDMNSETVKVLG